jgi:hypothetical protein
MDGNKKNPFLQNMDDLTNKGIKKINVNDLPLTGQ